MLHPSKDIVGTEGDELKAKRIVLCVCGSVAAAQCPEIARMLMRHGAEVHTVMTEAAQEIIHPNLMHWATGNDVTTELTGKIEHVALAGKHSGSADLVLVAPATANTISKIACGIDDTAVTTVVSTAFGSKTPIIIVPAMHESMYTHPLVTENIEKLQLLGVQFVGPKIEEGKAKIAEASQILAAIFRRLRTKPELSGLRMLITAGPTLEHIDPIRVVTNKSSGRMGVAIAEEALKRGAEVTLVYGPGREPPPSDAETISVESTAQMFEATMSELGKKTYHIVVAAAAPADWTVEKRFPRKISTHQASSITLKMRPTRKIIDHIKKVSPSTFLVAFKAEYRRRKKDLIEDAYRRLLEADGDLIVVNDVGKKNVGFGSEKNEVYIVDREKKIVHLPLAPKREISAKILDAAIKEIKHPRR